jgi:hypothetical protein
MTAKLTWGVFVGPPAPLAGESRRSRGYAEASFIYLRTRADET